MTSSYLEPRDYLKTSWWWIVLALLGATATWAPWRIDVLRSTEMAFAGLINREVGVSVFWDATLTLLNDDSFTRPLSILLIVFIFLLYAWRNRHTDMGGILGYLLWMTAGLALAIALAYGLTSRLERSLDIRGPRYHIENFRDINDTRPSWADPIDVSDEDSTPSREAMIYFSIFWMALFRSASLGAAMLVPSIVFGCAAMLVGREWPSSDVAGFFWSGAIAALLMRTPLAGAPRWLERVTMQVVENGMTFWIPSRPAKLRTTHMVSMPDLENSKVKIVAEVEDGRKHQVINDLIREQIVPALGAPPGETLEILRYPPNAQNKTSERRSRYVRFVCGGGLKSCVVVKAAWKPLAFFRSSDRIAKLRNAADVQMLMQLRDAAAPEVLIRREGRGGWSRADYFVSAERYIEGRPLIIGNLKDCREAARTLARMHSIERYFDAGPVHGDGVPRERYAHRDILPRVRRWMEIIDENMPAAEISFYGQKAVDWFWSQTVQVLDKGVPFALCHNDIAHHNIIVTDRKAVLMDFTRSTFALPAFDFVKAVIAWGGGSTQASRVIAETYFETLGETAFERYKVSQNLAIAYHSLDSLYQKLRTRGEKRAYLDTKALAESLAGLFTGKIEPTETPTAAADLIVQRFYGSHLLDVEQDAVLRKGKKAAQSPQGVPHQA